jgi:glycosyltransferase involved in cell wall biosynthesis
MSIALCIPAYNAAWCLPKLLISASKQVPAFNEILVYNDCSTDNTEDIAKQYGATVINGRVNVGCSTGKNELAKLAKSEWLHFHDADDDLLPNFTAVAQKWINRVSAPNIVLMHYHYIDFDTGKLLGQPSYCARDLQKDVVKFTIDNKVVNFALIRKMPFLSIGGFDVDPNVLYNEDRAFYTKASINGLSFGYEKELTCINYYYKKSMSASNRAKCAKAQYAVWKKVVHAVGFKYGTEITNQLYQTATYAATASEWRTVYRLLKLAKKISPGQVPIGSSVFLTFFKVNPFMSFLLREVIIRTLTNKRKI